MTNDRGDAQRRAREIQRRIEALMEEQRRLLESVVRGAGGPLNRVLSEYLSAMEGLTRGITETLGGALPSVPHPARAAKKAPAKKTAAKKAPAKKTAAKKAPAKKTAAKKAPAKKSAASKVIGKAAAQGASAKKSGKGEKTRNQPKPGRRTRSTGPAASNSRRNG
jgi:hypothetical protein